MAGRSVRAYEALVALGADPGTAARAARLAEPEIVVAWCEYAKGQRGLRNPIGLVLSKLRHGVAPPRVVRPTAARPTGEDPGPDLQTAEDQRRFAQLREAGVTFAEREDGQTVEVVFEDGCLRWKSPPHSGRVYRWEEVCTWRFYAGFGGRALDVEEVFSA